MHGKGYYGGAIASQAKSLIIKDCRFSDNLANCGAAIYQKGGNLRIVDSSFENNNATDWGAAIYDEGGDMQVESSKFTQNPGIHVICINGTRPMQANVLIKDCNVSNNPGVYGRTCDPSGAVSCTNSITIIGIWIDSESEVSMNDVIIEGNIADDDYGAIKNAGKLNLNEGTVIAKNTARRYSGLYSSESGAVNINKNAHIYDNVDKQQPPQSIHSEGILNMDPS